MFECETFPNEGPLWPCGCLMGDPACRCDADDPAAEYGGDPLAETTRGRHAATCPCGGDERSAACPDRTDPLAMSLAEARARRH